MPNIVFGPGINGTSLVPDQEMEFDTTSGVEQTTPLQKRLLIVGQALAAGAQPVGVALDVFRPTDAAPAYGAGSVLDLAIQAAYLAFPGVLLTALSLADNGAGTAATETLTIVGTAAASGARIINIGAQSIQVAITSGDTPTVQAAAVVAAVTANPNLPVTATSALGVVTFTFKHKGLNGNSTIISVSFSVTGLGVTDTLSGTGGAMAGGATDPTTLAATLANVAAQRFHDIVFCLQTSAAGLVAQTYVEGEGNPTNDRGEIAVQAITDVLSTSTTLATAINGARNLVCAVRGTVSLPWEVAAAMGAVMTSEEQATRPFNTLVLNGIAAPPLASRWIRSELDTLLPGGVTPLIVNASGKVCILRAVSTRVLNGSGNPDLTLLDITIIQGFDAVRDACALMIQQRYSRALFADNNDDGLLPDDVTTPAKVGVDLLNVLRGLESQGIVQNVEANASRIVVNKVGSNLEYSIPTDIIPGLQRALGKAVLIRQALAS